MANRDFPASDYSRRDFVRNAVAVACLNAAASSSGLLSSALAAEGQSSTAGKVTELTSKETSLGKVDSGIVEDSIIVSPTAKRIAYLAKRDGKFFAVLDGVQSKEYAGIWDLTFARRTERLAFLAALAEDRFVVVVDGKEGTPHAMVGEKTLTLSPDGEHVAYMVRKGKKITIVVDAVPGKEYDGLRKGSLQFTPDSKAVAFVAGSGGKQFVVVGDTEAKPYDGVWELAFSTEGKRVAFVAGDAVDQKYFVVVDGKPGKKFDGVATLSLVFSPDGKRLAYLAQVAQKCTLVIDGVEGKQHASVETPPIFSPDGNRVAYIAGEEEKGFVVLDGEEMKRYPGVPQNALVFSSDSRRFAYAATTAYKSTPGERYGIKTIENRPSEMLLVIDGKEESKCESAGKATFSPDSRRVAYPVKRNGKEYVVSDGIVSEAWDAVVAPTFSSDSKHLAYLAKQSGKWLIVLDGARTKGYDGIPRGGRLVFDTPGLLRGVVQQGDEILRVEVKVGSD